MRSTLPGVGPLLLAAMLVVSAPASAQSVKGGIDAWSRGDFAAALAQWRPLAARGNPDAMFNLGQANRLGRGVAIDLSQAQGWYLRAARLGHVDAQTQLGIMLFQNGNPKDAVSWLKRAAERGDPRAQLLYGTALYNGDGVPARNAGLGYGFVARAAAQGLGAARSTLADMDRELPEAVRRNALSASKLRPIGASVAASVSAPRNIAPAPIEQRSPVPPTVAVAHDGGWRVQLGAFSKKAGADALFATLVAGPLMGRQPYLVAAGPIIRLQAGPFASREEASRTCALLASRGQACFAVPAR